MDLMIRTRVLRPYVFLFATAFVVAAADARPHLGRAHDAARRRTSKRVSACRMVVAARRTSADVAVPERPAWGVALYYAVLAFNLIVSARIGEWGLAAALALPGLSRSREPRNDLVKGELQRA